MAPLGPQPKNQNFFLVHSVLTERKQGSCPKGEEVLKNTGGLLFMHPYIHPPLALSGYKSTHSGLKSALSDLESEREDLRPERTDFRSERVDLRPERVDFRSERTD